MSYPLQVQPTIVPNSFSANASRSQAPPQYNHYPPRYDGNLDYPQPQAIKPAELTNGETWTANVNLSMARDPRTQIARTPSPTPSEAHELESIGSSSGLINWKLVRSKDFWFSKKGLKYGLAAAVIITIAVLFAVYHKNIVIWLTPATAWCKDHKLGWLIPVGLLIVLSFPPLFGHELVGLLCGVTWGIGIGFGIVALGTLLGEVANFFTFKHCCTTRARKYEKKKISYACLARVIRTGGFKVALAARYSLIPAHLTTTIFASSGMSFTTFVAAAILSLPKQFATVVIGVLLEDSISGTSKKDKIASIAVAVISAVVTSFAFRYLNRKMDEVKPQVIYERRKARQAANLKMLSESTV